MVANLALGKAVLVLKAVRLFCYALPPHKISRLVVLLLARYSMKLLTLHCDISVIHNGYHWGINLLITTIPFFIFSGGVGTAATS